MNPGPRAIMLSMCSTTDRPHHKDSMAGIIALLCPVMSSITLVPFVEKGGDGQQLEAGSSACRV